MRKHLAEAIKIFSLLNIEYRFLNKKHNDIQNTNIINRIKHFSQDWQETSPSPLGESTPQASENKGHQKDPKDYVKAHHEEWKRSGIHPDLIALNFFSKEEDELQEAFFSHFDNSQRTNTGVIKKHWLDKYKFLANGGWWVSGIDPLTEARSLYGQCKPNTPRIDRKTKGFAPDKQKCRKYESPPRMATEPLFLAVSLNIWQSVADRVGLFLPENIEIDKDGMALGFWRWAIENHLSAVITEGAKKAACLLSQGFIAISVPGIYGGYRQPKDGWGKKNGKPYLHPLLDLFATEGRDITFCFDKDSKAKTIKDVSTAIAKTGKLFNSKGSVVSCTDWGFPEKGVDDLIAARGIKTFEAVYKNRFCLSLLNQRRLFDLTEYNPHQINVEYLSSENLVAPPDAQVIAIKSAKGTAKTQWISQDIEQKIRDGVPVLVPTHRIQLAKELCDRFGIDHIEDVRDSDTGGLLGYGLCIDSLHEKSQAHFCVDDWEGAILILDEAEQVFWHTLNSSTCQSNRVRILKTLKQLLQKVVATGGKIYLADADLTKIAIDYVKQLIGMPVKTWVAVNSYKSSDKRSLFVYTGKDPSSLIAAVKRAILRGGKVLIHLSAQKAKSKWGTINLEKILQKISKDLRILRIDGVSVADPEHPAMGCINNLDEVIADYDVVLASPVIETGVSIDIKKHFASVWCIAQGHQSVDSVCQTIARLRVDVPRHIWMPEKAPGYCRIANGSTFHKDLKKSTSKVAQQNIKLLERADSEGSEWADWDGWDDDLAYSRASFDAWSKRATLINADINRYREAIVNKLVGEGYILHAPDDSDRLENQEIKEEAKESASDGYIDYCESVPKVSAPSEIELKKLQKKRSKTKAERLQLKKGELIQKYGGIEVTPDLVAADDDGLHGKLRLHYYLTVGSNLLATRDREKLDALKGDDGILFAPDVNNRCLSAKVAAMKRIGVEQFLNPDTEFTKASLDKWFDSLIGFRIDIHSYTGVQINPQTDSGISVAQRLLRKMGMKLQFASHRRTASGKRERVYKFVPPTADCRNDIFAAWLEREKPVSPVEAAA